MKSLQDEIRFLLSDRSMPYEKMALLVSVIVALVFTAILSLNYAKDTPIMVIDLDNSRFSHELIDYLDNSQMLSVQAVLNSPTDPTNLMYRDKSYAVIYIPMGTEKAHYNGETCDIGVFYDNTSSSSLAGAREALNEIVAEVNNPQLGTGDTIQGGMMLRERRLFNPADSASNGEVVGFLVFFSSIFFAIATLGMIPRLRMEGKLELHLKAGSVFGLFQRTIPYCCCWLGATSIGFIILRFAGDISFTNNVLLYICVQALYIWICSLVSLLVGWSAPNPGMAASRMILFIPPGFILGGYGVPMTMLPEWVQWLNHIFPLTWDFKFIRDVVIRGASFQDCAITIGQFLIYGAIVVAIFVLRYYKMQGEYEKRKAYEHSIEVN